MEIVSKSQLMQLVIEGKHQEVMEVTDVGMFCVTEMRKIALESTTFIGDVPINKKIEILKCDIVSLCASIRQYRVYDEARVDELTEESIKEPGMMILYPTDPKHCLIDGTHRALRRQKEGYSFMYFFAFRPDQAIIPIEWIESPYDWGDQIIDGKIVKRKT